MKKIPKAEAIDRITTLLAHGLSYRAIGERIGLSPSRICQIVKDFGITKRCSHCGLAIACHPRENMRETLRPEES